MQQTEKNGEIISFKPKNYEIHQLTKATKNLLELKQISYSVEQKNKPQILIQNTYRQAVRHYNNASSGSKVLYRDANVKLKEGSNTFYAGNCTRYVASKYKVDWHGNAGNWLENAEQQGHTIKNTPEAGDVFVSNESSYGHTGIVKNVDYEKGTMIVEEMNYKGYGIVSEREVPIDDGRMKGFIDGNDLSDDEEKIDEVIETTENKPKPKATEIQTPEVTTGTETPTE